ncbi:hypothetical protein LWC34_29240 [Kibdelosporangium philippinense]|uniref:Uncharacterized protein n=1 Tax=Kibdelosporangium philippinense TaxID=211113 RepID=A0ABS8ZJS1_9PSEU|nr:hypothetical protein [Kibdelosporangium philippinense]MCE7006881.1 hypothetical protein [Kibdelosporangium philippinense]
MLLLAITALTASLLTVDTSKVSGPSPFARECSEVPVMAAGRGALRFR